MGIIKLWKFNWCWGMTSRCQKLRNYHTWKVFIFDMLWDFLCALYVKLPICPLFNALRYNYIIHVITNSTSISFIKKTQEWRCTCYFIMYFGLSPCRHVRNKEHINPLNTKLFLHCAVAETTLFYDVIVISSNQTRRTPGLVSEWSLWITEISGARHKRVNILIINLTKIDNETAVVKIQQLCKLSRALIDLGGGNYKI